MPYNRIAQPPVHGGSVSRDTYYGFVNRDFQKAQQDFGTLTASIRFTDNLVLSSKLRAGALGARLYRHAAEATVDCDALSG